MTHVKRDTEEPSDGRSETKQEAKNNAGDPTRDVPVYEFCKSLHTILPDPSAKGVLGDGGRNAIEGSEVLEPAAGQGGDPENDTGNRGVDCGSGAKGIKGLIDVFGAVDFQVWSRDHECP